MSHLPRRYTYAFLAGCLQPDQNPATYLKGSVRHKFFHGHNWNNAKNYMQRICRRLEGRKQLKLWDYYTMGKLIHYTADAFTLAHNDFFDGKMHAHRVYEFALQDHFIHYLGSRPYPTGAVRSCLADIILSSHADYTTSEKGIHTDCHYSVTTCCEIISSLLIGNHPVFIEKTGKRCLISSCNIPPAVV